MTAQDADTVRCQASISGNCLSLTEGWSLCEDGECVYGAFLGEMPDDGKGAALTDGPGCAEDRRHSR
jgi:hypothetical protein